MTVPVANEASKEPYFGECPYCEQEGLISYGPDPYREDVNNDPTPVWECADCDAQSRADI